MMAPAIAVFCSGEGTNLQAILDAIRAGRLRARVALVIADRPEAKALARAARAGVAARCVTPADYPTRAAFERALIRACEAHDVRLICLAGFMRILSPVFVRRYRHHILNVHPALLPAFPGSHAVRDALRWGAKVTGVTVHLVDEEVDHGPILLQETVRVLPSDTERTLLAKVHRVEHMLYPKAIEAMLYQRRGLTPFNCRLTKKVSGPGRQRKISRRVLGRTRLRPVGRWISRTTSKDSNL